MSQCPIFTGKVSMEPRGELNFQPTYLKYGSGVTAYFCWGSIIGHQREAEHIHHSALLLQLNQGTDCLKKKRINRIQSLLI